ncbi:MAG: amidohydrolase family protein [Spirochaetes bacterium]|nr:amidohydrolase family protein [Spirochaetota bacterium]MBU1080051.1 amidohydrolase family protein [Spirochaetota bacterium]
MRVIDSHVHFPEDKIIDDGLPAATGGSAAAQVGYSSGRSGAAAHPWIEAEKARWESAWRFPPSVAVEREEGERLWLGEIEKRDYLDSVVFVTSGSNDFCSELARRNEGKFYGYAHHDPLLPDAADRLEKALKVQGLRGYKLLGPKIGRPLDDPSFDPLWEIASAAGAPVLIHFGIMGGAGGIAGHVNISPMVVHDVAKRFPSLRIIVPHFGCGYVFETLNLCWACPNVYVDTSGSNQWMRWMPYPVDLASLFRKYHDTIGASRIIFGTDSSWFPRGFAEKYLDIQVREMYDNGFDEDEVDMVLYRNIAGLLGIA